MKRIVIISLILIAIVSMSVKAFVSNGKSNDSSGLVGRIPETPTNNEASAATKDEIRTPSLEEPKCLMDYPEIMLYKKNYTVSYNITTFCPNYVAWHLTPERVNGSVSRTNNFHPDESLDFELQVVSSDYSNSGLDRGHMCPAADNKDSRESMEDSFTLTNICPQNRSLNAGPWNDLEIQCRNWVLQYDDLYIVCGPIFESNTPNTIGKEGRMRIAVPDKFFKVVLRMGDKPQAIGFIYDNTQEGRSMRTASLSVDAVEEITGIDFYPALPDNIENEIESEHNPQAWGLR